MVTSQEMVSIKKSFFDFDSYHFIKVFMRFSWKEKKIVSLNECHIKRQSTKNATESTVSLGEKFTSFGSGLGPVWVEFGSSLGRVWVRFGSGFGNLRDFSNFKIRCELYFAPNYQFFSFHFFEFLKFLVFQWWSNIFDLGIFRILTVASSDGRKSTSLGPKISIFRLKIWWKTISRSSKVEIANKPSRTKIFKIRRNC